MKTKNIVASDENWEKLHLLKLKWKKASIDEVISELIIKAGDSVWQ